jgi:hypothetical protein
MRLLPFRRHECKQESDVEHTVPTSPALATGSDPTNPRSLNMSCFVNQTQQTTQLPAKGLRNINLKKARQAEEVAKLAQGKRSSAARSGPCTLTEVEELIGNLVGATPGNGYLPLLPHTDVSLYYKVGASKRHVDMYNKSAVMATDPADPAAVNEQWRRFIGQQLILLVELMTFCVPAFFTDNAATINPLGKRKARGAVRSDLSLNKQSFVPTRAKADTAAVRSFALQYARNARVCDVQYNVIDTALLGHTAGLVLPREHDEKTVLMLKEPTLTPTGSLLSFCTDVIMQVQCAAVLGRLPSVCSLLVSATKTEMDRFKAAHNGTAVDEDTPCVSIAQLWSGARLSAANAPPAVLQFVRAAAESGDTLLPYYGVYRLARCLFKPNEEITASTMNGVTSRFRTLLNGLRVLHLPHTEPLYQVLDGLHKPYQVCTLILKAFLYFAEFKQLHLFSCSRTAQAQIRNQQAQDTSVSITRGARTLKGRLPAVEDGADSVREWKTATNTMKQAMSKGTFEPFKAALEKGLMVHNSNLEHFVSESSALLRRRRLYRADGGAVRDAAAGDAASAPFLILMQKVVAHMVQVSRLSLHDVANYEAYLFFTSCLLGTATLRDQAYRQNLIDDVYMDEAGFVNESIFAPLQLKVKASLSESGHLLVADVKPRESTLSWLVMVCAVRPMRAVLHDTVVCKQIWGLSGIDNTLVSRSAWANHIQVLSKLHLGSPRTGKHKCACRVHA